MTIATVPLIVSILGLLIYALTPPASTRVVEIGRLMFGCGLLAALFASASHVVRIGAG